MNEELIKEKPIYEQLGYDPDPPFYAPTSKPIVTNYDRIIRKTPEELAGWLHSIRYSWMCVPRHNGNRCSDFNDDCNACWLNWLKKEAET